MQKRHFLIILLVLLHVVASTQQTQTMTYIQGAIVRGDSAQKEVALVFTADEFGEGLPTIIKTLRTENVKAGFFFTGRFYRNPSFREPIKMLQQEGHYLGPHSDKHLLYNDWTKRDSLLVSRDSFSVDLANNLATMKALSLPVFPAHLFIPPYEWWNDSIASWTMRAGLRLFSFTPGIRTAADYTYPEMGAPYKSSEWILNWLKDLLTNSPQKISGAIILIHAGTDPRRKDKLYDRLPEFIQLLKKRGYVFRRVDELIE